MAKFQYDILTGRDQMDVPGGEIILKKQMD